VLPSKCRVFGNETSAVEKREDSAIVSAEIVAASDTKALHFGLQSSSFQCEALCGPVWTRDDTVRFPQNADDMLPFGVVERMVISSERYFIVDLVFFQRNPQHGSFTEDDGAFHEVL